MQRYSYAKTARQLTLFFSAFIEEEKIIKSVNTAFLIVVLDTKFVIIFVKIRSSFSNFNP